MFVNVFISCILYPLTLAEYVNVWKCIHILYPLTGRVWESVYKSLRSKRYGVCNIVYAVYIFHL